ncbi:hypothetical protein RJZ56_007392 [Blastomyces dermatitidis]|uniref:Uncharacterized protein n=2 Tax=Blastomyces TaxID=229219 RepID=A0A179UYA5_BLAGS|nr:uncharacterized protein BDBG_08118 [Blastomyces gilchristii SLH14081]EGE81897.2 hypothetical protein BDDG_04840 [Blastomyces dermatitidis ATCC 18188]OAT12820.1 hypothetical protein BDBG_08118 [Blastomyces gilchristii SLH14081]
MLDALRLRWCGIGMYDQSKKLTLAQTARHGTLRSRGTNAVHNASLGLPASRPLQVVPQACRFVSHAGPNSSNIIALVSYVVLGFLIVHFMGVFLPLPFAPPLVPELCVSRVVLSLSRGTRLPKGYGSPVARHSGAGHDGADEHCVLRHRGSERAHAKFLMKAYVVSLSGPGVEEHGAGEHLVLSLGQHAGLISNGLTASTVVRTTKFVDYKKHALLPRSLASAYGLQALYANLQDISVQVAPLVNIGAFHVGDGVLRQMVRWFLNSSCLTWISGNHRSYILFTNTPNMYEVLTLVEIVEQGRLKAVLDSSRFAIEDLMKACELVTSRMFWGKVLIRDPMLNINAAIIARCTIPFGKRYQLGNPSTTSLLSSVPSMPISHK